MNLRLLCGLRRVLGVVVSLAGLSCGVQPVELRPGESVTTAGDRVIGKVPASAIAQLQAQRDVQGDEALHLIYPVPAPTKLVIPADLAPIAFEWRSGKKPAGMGMMPDMPMPDGMDVAGMAGMAAMAGMAMPMGKGAMMDPMSQPGAAGPAAMGGTVAQAGQAAPPPPPPPPPPEAMEAKAKSDKADKDRPIAYELQVRGPSLSARLYAAAEGGAFLREDWASLLRANIGAELSVVLRGVRQDGAIVHAAPLQISVRAAMPTGLFYSFSTTSLGLTLAPLSATHDTRLAVPLTSEQGSGCVGCHAISRNGKRMLAATTAPSQLYRWPVMSTAALRLDWPKPAAANMRDYVQGTFDFTAARIAATQSGSLLIFDADTGALLEQSAAPLSAAVSAPDWSPDGRTIVVEASATKAGDDMAGGSSLATVQVGLDGRQAELKPLISGMDDEQLRAPRYSPDGEWIVYEKRVGPLRDARDSKLFIVSAATDQRAQPIELRGLAQGSKPMDGARAPAFALGDQPGHVYLLFSSRRPIGSFVPAEGQRQLFASELDLSLAAAGQDPSHAAFWLPFQQHSNSYLQGQWGPALSACTPSPEVCDDSDDDCDGAVDEDCCKPAAESCGDGSDNDCDGALDEGCGCAFQETCGNQLDDDCDLRTDEKPCMPAPSTKEP